MSALQMAASAENSGDGWGAIRSGTGTGDGWGAVRTGTGTGDGWGKRAYRHGYRRRLGRSAHRHRHRRRLGGKGNQIRAIQPFGKLMPGAATFRWSKARRQSHFQTHHFRPAQPNHAGNHHGRYLFTVDLTKAPFQAGVTYQWSIGSDEAPAAVSNTLQIELSDATLRNAAIERVQRAPTYAQSPPEVQMLMQAVSLEQADFCQDAAGFYGSLQKSQPKNQLVRIMHAAFWVRYGLKEMAREAYSGQSK